MYYSRVEEPFVISRLPMKNLSIFRQHLRRSVQKNSPGIIRIVIPGLFFAVIHLAAFNDFGYGTELPQRPSFRIQSFAVALAHLLPRDEGFHASHLLSGIQYKRRKGKMQTREVFSGQPMAAERIFFTIFTCIIINNNV